MAFPRASRRFNAAASIKLNALSSSLPWFYAQEYRQSRLACQGPPFSRVNARDFVFVTIARGVSADHYMLETPCEAGSTTLSERLMRSCARHLLVAASSRSTDEKVASRRGSGRHCRSASRALALSLSLDDAVSQSPPSKTTGLRGRQDSPKKAANDVLEESSGLRFDELSNHIAQHRTDSIKALVGGADVVEPVVVEQNLLHDEDGDGLAKLRASLHDSKAEGNNLGGKQKVDDVGRVVLDEGPNDTEASKPQVFKGSRLGRRIEERVEKEGNMRC